MRSRVLRQRRRFTIVVTLKTGAVFRGVLFDADAQCLVLRRTEILTPDARSAPVDGELLVFVADIDTIQRV